MKQEEVPTLVIFEEMSSKNGEGKKISDKYYDTIHESNSGSVTHGSIDEEEGTCSRSKKVISEDKGQKKD